MAERHLSKQTDSGPRLNVWANEPHTGPLEILKTREYSPGFALEYKRRRHMEGQVEDVPRKDGHVVRALGDIEELPARSWASWAAFHPNNPDADYRGWEWYRYVQRCPLYRRDLDIVAISPNGCVASFCAAWFDAAARTGAFEPVGTDKIIGATAWVRL